MLYKNSFMVNLKVTGTASFGVGLRKRLKNVLVTLNQDSDISIQVLAQLIA